MRIYFAPCGIGLGHVGRCIPIARRLQQDHEVYFSTYQEGASYAKQERLPLVEVPPIGFQVKPDGTIDFRQTAVNPGPFVSIFTLLKQTTAEIQAMESFQPDIIVSDSRISPLLAARMLGIPRICILNQFQVIVPRKTRFLNLARIADFMALSLIGKLWTSGNQVLIPDFRPPYTICSGNLHIPDAYRKNVQLIGPILPIHSKQLDSQDRLRKKLGLPANKPVIFVPISGPIRERAFFSNIMKSILPGISEKIEVVLSLGYPGGSNILRRFGNLSFCDWIPNRFEFLKASDLVISRAGHGTITQCMCYGKPMILVPTPSHTEQISNAKQAMDIGVAKVIQQENLNKDRLVARINEVLESNMSERLEQIQREVSESDGLESAAKIITERTKHREGF